MIRRIVVTIVACAAAAAGAYTYYSTDDFANGIDAGKWVSNGTLGVTGGILTSADANGGSLISNENVPDGTSDYEVRTTLKLGASGGSFAIFLRATSNARLAPATGNFYAFEIASPTMAGLSCTATLNTYKAINGSLTPMAATLIPCRDGMVVRAIARGDLIVAYIDGVRYGFFDNAIATGKAGLGVRQAPAGNGFQVAQLGPLDRVAPLQINGATISTSVYPNFVDARWQPPNDDANGSGVAFFYIERNGGGFTHLLWPATTTDASVAASSTYYYTLWAIDYHENMGPPIVFQVNTPPAGSIDPRRVGLRSNGAYWGSAGENIDMASGNLNFTLPILKALGRGGSSMSFGLSYNSQIWRRDGVGDWKLGRDLGYGLGWKLQAGSLTPFWTDWFTIDHWMFMDSTGAEYRLDVNTNGVWTSRESIYVSYDQNAQRLYFNDGTYWQMDAVASGTEQDAGTRYPTRMVDANGNFIALRYAKGMGSAWDNSSGRISEIEDVRAVNVGGVYKTFSFAYNNNQQPLLTNITSHIGTAENYILGYLENQTLYSPFTPQVWYGGATLLTSITASGVNLTHSFEYGSSQAGELTKVILPYKGWLRWEYADWTYSGARTQREVSWRYLKKSPNLIDTTETSHGLFRDPGDGQRTYHFWASLQAGEGTSSKVWFFALQPLGNRQVSMVTMYEDRAQPGNITKTHKDFFYTADAGGNLYTSSVVSAIDPNAAYAKVSKVEQTVDGYGNLTQSKIYDYGNLTTPARTYTHTYLTNSNYTSRYIRNRLLSSSVTNGSQNVTLVTNTYDGSVITNIVGLRQHDSASYGTSFGYRGNVTQSVTPGATSNTAFDITGTATSVNDGQVYTVAIAQASGSNHAVPGVVTPNSQSNLETRATYNSWLGVTSVVQPGATASSTYDIHGRLEKSTSPYGAETLYSYDPAQATVTATVNGRWQKTRMDGFGRTIQVESGHGSTTVSFVDTEYEPCACSALGKVKKVSQPYAPNPVTKYWTTYSYDALGRTLSVVHPDNSGTTTYLYEGNAVKITDPATKWKRHVRDALGNLTQVTEPNPAGADLITNYSYNIVNQLTQVSMTRGPATQIRSFGYNAQFRLETTTNPESGTVTYSYNPNGTLMHKIDAKNQKTAYVYDGFRRVNEVNRHPVSTGPADVCQSLYMYYDLKVTTDYGFADAWGQLTGVEWGDAELCAGGLMTEAYSYWTGGLVAAKQLRVEKVTADPWNNGVGKLTGYWAYDNEGRMTGEAYPDDSTILYNPPTYAYTFDAMKRPIKMSASGVDWVKDVVYGPAGEMTEMKYLLPGGGYYTEARTYNKRLQLTNLTASGPGVPPLNLEYCYSENPLNCNQVATQNNGQIRKMKDWISGEEVTYQYDVLSRLISAATTGPEWGLSFTYDGFGNKTQQTATKGSGSLPQFSAAVDGLTNRFVGAGYTYDANGNLTSMGTYDVANRLAGHVYGPRNERIMKGSEVYFYSPDGRRLGTYQMVLGYGVMGLNHLRTNVYFAGKLIREAGEAVVLDRLGSVRVRGSQTMNYYPYGEERTTTPDNYTKFGTYFRDAPGVDYADQRYYSNAPGRFLTPDPYVASGGAQEPGSWNRYAYVENDPVNKLDRTGLYWESPNLLAFEIGFLGGGGGNGWGWGRDAWGLFPWEMFPLPNDVPSPLMVNAEPSNPEPSNPEPPDPEPVIPLPGDVFTLFSGFLQSQAATCPLIGPLAVPCGVLKAAALALLGGIALYEAWEDRSKRLPTVDDLQASCAPGRLLIEPAVGRAYRGGTSHEQEYICKLGVYTVHWIERDGRILHGPHVRPGPPKGGGGLD